MLVIDDEESICLGFERFFSRRGWSVRTAATARAGRAAFRTVRPDVVFLDVRLPDADGLDVLRELRQIAPRVPVIVITAYGGLDTVVGSVKAEAFDYLPKPIDLDQAERLTERAVESPASLPSRAGGTPASAASHDAGEMVGVSRAMQEIFKRIAVLARTDCSVLVLGDTGVGKERVARAIHRHSARARGPFEAVNCGALPANLVESELFGHVRGAFTGADADRVGKFQAADGGVLFLDEVGELPGEAQVKLLRVLDRAIIQPVGGSEPQPLDVRVVAATNRDLSADIEAGRFRADLYYRLAVVQIVVPPLAQRPEDVLPLARRFLAEHDPDRTLCLDAEAEKALCECSWPGNVRQLRNAIAHAAAMQRGGVIRPEDLPEAVGQSASASGTAGSSAGLLARYVRGLAESGAGNLHPRATRELEAELIRYALAACDGRQADAAEMLGLHRNTLRKKLRQLDQA